MPYIKAEDRIKFEKGLDELNPETAGELNYIFTKLILHYIADKGGQKYQLWNDTVGAMECCKMELYRRFIAPYEDTKIKENGDV